MSLKNRFKKWESFVKRRWWLIRSYLIFFGCILAFLPLLFLLLKGNTLEIFYANLTGYVLGFLGNQIRISGTVINTPDFSFKVIKACTGVITSIIFISAVIAYPSKLKSKLVGLATGLPAILFLNLIRLITLYYVGSLTPSTLDTIHFLIWQPLFILAVLIFWFIWVNKVANVVLK